MQYLQPSVKSGEIRTSFQRLVDTHRHEIRQAVLAAALRAAQNFVCLSAISCSAAIRAGNIYIRQKLDIQGDLSRPVAGRTAQFPCVIGEIAGLILAGFGSGRPGVKFF